MDWPPEHPSNAVGLCRLISGHCEESSSERPTSPFARCAARKKLPYRRALGLKKHGPGSLIFIQYAVIRR